MKISIIIPTLNEAGRLEKAVAWLRLTAAGGSVAIIVADGGSQDSTLAAAERLADKVVESAPGRAIQMHAGALAAEAGLLLFLHADTRLPRRWRQALLDAWTSHPRPGATAYRLGFDSQKPIYNLIAALGDRRSRWIGVPHGDQAIACRREDYLAVGGFPPVPLMEEYFLLPKLARLGPLMVIADAVETSTRRYERTGPIFNALRNAAILALFRTGVSPERLARLYR